MKTIGIILCVFAVLNLIVGFIALANGAAEAAGGKFGAFVLLGGIGYALYYSGKKKNNKEEKSKGQSE